MVKGNFRINVPEIHKRDRINLMIDQIAGPIFLSIVSYMLIFKPMKVSKFLGGIYWHGSKFTAIGQSEETKQYFYSQNPFWFRVLGILLVGLLFVQLLSLR
jgi:hypothetical protein